MATERAKNLWEAAFLLRQVSDKLNHDKANPRGLAKRRIEAKRDEVSILLGQIDSQINSHQEANTGKLVKQANKLFDDEFSPGDERKKILVQLNDLRRRDKSTAIRISTEARDSLRTIRNEKGFANDNDVVEYLLRQYAAK